KSLIIISTPLQVISGSAATAFKASSLVSSVTDSVSSITSPPNDVFDTDNSRTYLSFSGTLSNVYPSLLINAVTASDFFIKFLLKKPHEDRISFFSSINSLIVLLPSPITKAGTLATTDIRCPSKTVARTSKPSIQSCTKTKPSSSVRPFAFIIFTHCSQCASKFSFVTLTNTPLPSDKSKGLITIPFSGSPSLNAASFAASFSFILKSIELVVSKSAFLSSCSDLNLSMAIFLPTLELVG